MITSAELTQMRVDILDLLPDTCALLTVTHSSDGQGGNTDTWGTATASVACRLDQKKASEVIVSAGVRPFSGWMLTLPYNTTINEQYRIEHGGNTYNVISVDGDKSWSVTIRAEVDRV